MKKNKINKVIIFCKLGLEDSLELKLLINILKREHIDYDLYVNKRNNQGFSDLESVDLLISFGGDGNMISACRLLANTNIPVLGVHAGTLGFLTELKVCEFEEFLSDFYNNLYIIEKPYLFKLEIQLSNGKKIKKYALNDAVLNRDNHLLLADIEVYVKNDILNKYHADGLILSTPIGSTAYNMSAGGAIIYPLSSVFAITPICSHSLTQRPIILPKGFKIKVISKNCTLSLDGQEIFNSNDFVSFTIELSNVRASILRRENRSYFNVLSDKLKWGELK